MLDELSLWDWSCEYGCGHEGMRRRAWTEHLIAKGCHPKTAESKAYARMRSPGKWPPKTRVS